ncbi:cytochrome [Mycobacterium sp. 852013-50091_SCH5140682]|uniref:cytochrome P450 n=1 Tax=Mycobacterium sp. 852013-50091_SCH5140682 TaxID=1834109 RepID=UPI0007EC1B47|nr:cytochrome P450 [Mycobacterium sp. 852013-50091_SCH5140682]OBC03397.1 cytochrome [Mycobacterium sp. 852013-50091_SCH5140682]
MSTEQLTDAPYLNLADPAFSVQSADVRTARDENWYARTPYGLAVLRYDEVGKLMKDRRLRQGSWAWPAHNGVTEGAFAHWWSKALLNIEGEDHHRLRRLMNPAFSPKLIGGLVPRFQALANELIDTFYDEGHCDFAAQFAEPYAARVIAIMLGIDESHWKRIAAWSNDIGLSLGVTFKQDLDRIETALAGLYGYADDLIAERQANPGDDFVSRLVLAERDGEHLSRDELRVALVLLIFGGMDTTRNQLGLAMQTFMTYPDQWELLARRPELGKAAVEEAMRVNPTVTWVTREALEDFDYQGLHITAGTTIHLLSESAGTDPRVIDGKPFDLEATRPAHFGFGGGIHHCLGHFVARSDMSEALPLLARRLRNPRIDGTPTWLPLSGNTGPIYLPISFDRA